MQDFLSQISHWKTWNFHTQRRTLDSQCQIEQAMKYFMLLVFKDVHSFTGKHMHINDILIIDISISNWMYRIL